MDRFSPGFRVFMVPVLCMALVFVLSGCCTAEPFVIRCPL